MSFYYALVNLSSGTEKHACLEYTILSISFSMPSYNFLTSSGIGRRKVFVCVCVCVGGGGTAKKGQPPQQVASMFPALTAPAFAVLEYL